MILVAEVDAHELSAEVEVAPPCRVGDPAALGVRPTGGGHWRVSRDGHQSITMAKSPSDHRTLMNVRQDVRRYLGIEL